MLQMTCPFCKKEFPYDNGAIDAKISKLGQEIKEINLELTKFKLKPLKERKAQEGWRRIKVVTLAEKQKEIGELKAVRKAADQQLKYAEYSIFRGIIKDKYGEEECKRLLEQVQEEMKAYKISGLMWHEYSRSRSKANVTSINKL